jgi:hypothetical protein
MTFRRSSDAPTDWLQTVFRRVCSHTPYNPQGV